MNHMREGRARSPTKSVVRAMMDAFDGYDGFILDAEDISTLNQVSTGTTPVTAVTQPIGWFGDKRLGMQLGPELNNDPSFDNSASWLKQDVSIVVSGGVATFTNTTDAKAVYQARAQTAGKTQKIIVVVDNVTAGAVRVSVNGFSGPNITTAGTYEYSAVCTAASTVGIYSVGTTTAVVSSFSVKLLDGNHALQATAAARPTWQVDANGHHYAQLLGTDDSLSCETGGGGSTGFLFCAALKPTGGAGTARQIFSDAANNGGYVVLLSVTNKLQISAGNGTAYTSLPSTSDVSVGTLQYVTAYDDGTSLKLQIDGGIVESVARPVVSAGSTGFSIGKNNTSAVQFLIADFYRAVYIKNWAGTAAQLAAIQSWVKAGAGL